jgi:hypothetical protein
VLGEINQSEENELFLSCVREMMRKKVPTNISCTTPPFKNFLPDMNNCKEKNELINFMNNFAGFFNNIVEKPHSIGCPLPCRQIYYKVTLDYTHKNLFNGKSFEYFFFQYKYSTLLVEERIESYDYDIGSFLVAAGGNLGLFLGFSCFSILFFSIELMKKLLLMF